MAASIKKPTVKSIQSTPKAPPDTKRKPAGQAAYVKSSSFDKMAKSTVLSSKVSFRGRVFDVYTDTVREPNGLILKRDVIRHIGSVVILAIDESRSTKDPEIIIERQYRHAIGDFLLELPAGRIEPNELPLAAAKREMIEETGYRARKWSLLTRYFPSPGFLGESMKIYLARDIREGVAQPEADEQIEIIKMRLSQAMAMVRAGRIQDGKTLIGLSLLAAAIRERRM